MYNSKQKFIEKPLHLVSINSFGKLVLHYQAINYLKTLKSPISILSIAGPYRTGKSFLLNSLISTTGENIANSVGISSASNNNSAGNSLESIEPSFQVGHTTNQTTHGLWIWSKPILAYDQNNQITNVIVMDSQGYASTQSTHDKRLITLALLLSTCFLYNSKGVIDKQSLFDLQFVIQVARLIKQKEQFKANSSRECQQKESKQKQEDKQKQNQKQKEDLRNKSKTFPKSNCDFHWILRDFHLELVNQLGHKITSTQYMENSLLQAGQKVNSKTVQTLKQYFPNRNCHTLCQPNLNLSNVNGHSSSLLSSTNASFIQSSKLQQRPQFISQLLQLKQSILKKGIKSYNKLSGSQFITIIKSYVDSMNNGEELEQIFQQGYDCRVRLDCLDKLNTKLKKLQQQLDNVRQQNRKDEQLQQKLQTIKQQLKQYYNQRMCSHKQIKVLDNDVEQMLQQYQKQKSSSKNLISNYYNSTSVKCVERQRQKSKQKQKQSRRSFLQIPKARGHFARLSIHCSEKQNAIEQGSFIEDQLSNCGGSQSQDQESDSYKLNSSSNDTNNITNTGKTNNITNSSYSTNPTLNMRASRTINLPQRKSIQKQKTPPQMKALSLKCQQLQINLHRLELQIQNYQSDNTHLKQENQLFKHKLILKEDQILQVINQSLEKHNLQEIHIRQLEEKEKNHVQTIRLQSSEIQKLNLLYQEKIHFLETQIQQGDQQRLQQFIIQKNNYKQKVRELTEEISQMKQKHEEQLLQLRQMFNISNSMIVNGGNKNRTMIRFGTSSSQNNQQASLTIYQELSLLQKQNNELHSLLQQLSHQKSKLIEQMSLLQQRLSLQQSSHEDKLQQQAKRHEQATSNINQLHEQKLQNKQSYISQLTFKIKSLNQLLKKQNEKSISSIKQLQTTYSEEKEDLFNMNNQLRNGCLQALQRVGHLREELEMKQKWLEQATVKGNQLNKKVEELKQQKQLLVDASRDKQQKLKLKLQQVQISNAQALQKQKEHLAQKQQQIHTLNNQLKKSLLQLEIQKQMNQQKQQQIIEQKQLIKSQQQSIQQIEKEIIRQQQLAEQLEQRYQTEVLVKNTQLNKLSTKLEQQLKLKQQLNKTIHQLNNKFTSHHLQHQHNENAHELNYNQQQQKYQELIKQQKNKYKQLNNLFNSIQLEMIKKQQQMHYTERQLQNSKSLGNQTKSEFIKAKEQFCNKQKQYQSKQRQINKQFALNKQKLLFVEKQLFQTKQLLLKLKDKQFEWDQKQKNMDHSLKALDKQNKQFMEIQHNLKIKLEGKCKEKEANDAQINALRGQLQKIHKALSLTSNDKQILEQNLLQLHQHLRLQQINSQNHLRLYSSKFNLIKKQKQQLQTKLQNKQNQLQNLKIEQNKLMQNYEKDFQLWTRKLSKMEELLKEAGWVEYSCKEKVENKCNLKSFY